MRSSSDIRSKAYAAAAATFIAVLALVLLPSQVLALTGPQRLTFGEFGEGAEISTQYAPQGVVFNPEGGLYPEIRWDGSSDENPVLSGAFGFGSAISAQFVQPGGILPATVENLSMDVGYINEPDSTVLTVYRTTGPEDLYADEFGFDHLSLSGGDIIGFRVETADADEPAGWEIDNLEYTIPTPPPPAPPPAPAPPDNTPTTPTDADACPSISGPVWKQVLGLYQCKNHQKGACALNLVLDLPDGKAFKTADGLYDLAKVGKKLAPAATLYNDIGKVKVLPGAPDGFKTIAQIRDKVSSIHDVYDAVKLFPYLKKALDKQDFIAIYNDLVDLAGVRPCIDLITSW